jgi:hypothetical protein
MNKKIYLKVWLLLLGLGLTQSIVAQQFTISGKLETPLGLPMKNFKVLVTGTENKLKRTDANGNFSFDLQAGGNYKIEPISCGDFPLNGVTTFDLVLITKHLDGVELLNSPYKILAADVDGSNSLNEQDTSMIRQLIMGSIIEFPGGNIRFALKNHVLQDPTNPFLNPPPPFYTINNLQDNVSGADFICMKLGDVNNTAIDLDKCDEMDFRVQGKVYSDQDGNCDYDLGEAFLKGWLVEVTNGVDTYFGTTDSQGDYYIGAIPGVFDVILHKPNELWEACSDTITGVQVTAQGVTDLNFGLQVVELCPAMDVSLSAPIMRRCFNNHYRVQYCNFGTLEAQDAYIEIKFDTFFNVLTSTLPWSSSFGNTYVFPVGDVAPGDCGNIDVTFYLSCDALLGQTHCTEARIYPDTSCAGPFNWEGPELRVEGHCAGDEVVFQIRNLGESMQSPSNYIVVEDIVVMMPTVSNPFTLQAGGMEVITVPANGATWRLEAEQAPGYPWGTVASATVEGCGTNSAGGVSLGLVNQFPQDDESPLVDIDCVENIGSFDPNDKQGFPRGALEEHYIPLRQPIDYLIRFQNTGTDTAFTVKILDTLSSHLDPSTLRFLGSSHACYTNLISANVVEFLFPNILLPDSNVNEPASHGFVKFNISPKKDLPHGTLIENGAAIYFDFNAPVITNTTWHTLGEKFLNANILSKMPDVALEVFPNPSSDQATFLIKSPQSWKGNILLYDLAGRQVAQQSFVNNQFHLNTKTMKSGLYWFRLESGGQTIATGKLAVVQP